MPDPIHCCTCSECGCKGNNYGSYALVTLQGFKNKPGCVTQNASDLNGTFHCSYNPTFLPGPCFWGQVSSNTIIEYLNPNPFGTLLCLADGQFYNTTGKTYPINVRVTKTTIAVPGFVLAVTNVDCVNGSYSLGPDPANPPSTQYFPADASAATCTVQFHP